MLEPQRTPGRALAARRVRDVDVYAQPTEIDRPRPNLLAVLWRRRWIVVACVLVGLIASIIYYSRSTPVYAASSVIYVQGNALAIVNDPMGNGARSQGYLFTQCQLITSTAILSEAAQRPSMAGMKSMRGIDNPVGFLKSCVSAAPDKISDLITVSAESVNADDAATIVNAVVEAYIDQTNRTHRSTAVEVLKIFQKEVDQHESDLAAKEKAILKMKQENPDLSFQTEKGSMITNKLGELAERLTQAQLRSLDIRTALAEAEAVKDDPIALRRLVEQFQVSGEQGLALDPGVMATYRASRARLEEMLETLGKQHDLVKAAERQVQRSQEDLQLATRDTAASYSELLKQSQRIADARVKELQTAMNEARTSAVSLNFKQAEYEQLRKEEDRITRSLELLDSRIKEINVNEDVGSITVSVLEVGKPSFLPVRPVQSKTLGLGLIGGLMLGMGLAMLRDLMDQRLRSADEITALLDLPIIGVIPHMHGRSKSNQTARVVEMQPRSNVAEAYRTLRTAVYFGMKEGAGVKTILVTSPAPGDGKSTCSSNLALAFAQSGRRTLLIDADCRRPTQDRNYECDQGIGVADVLVGRAELKDAIRPSGVENLDLLVGGTLPPNPAELLDSQSLLNMLGQVSEMYDQVVIDSPPVVPVTDSRILAASCDAAILVLRAERSTRRLAEHAREAMLSVGANLLGVVVNDVPRGKDGYGYDYYGYGRYGYRSTTNGHLTNGHAANGSMVVSSQSVDE